MTPTIQQLNHETTEHVSTVVQLNHDLNFLYLIARTVLPKDVLETLMYGEDFEEPTEEDFKEIVDLIVANDTIVPLLNAYDDKILAGFEDEVCQICGGNH